MFNMVAAQIIGQGVKTLSSHASNEKNKSREVFKKIAGHPVKVLATFLTAPILVVKVAWQVKNPIRRLIAILGLLVSILLSYVAATFLGTLAGVLFVASNIGYIAAFGFWMGATLSVYLSVIFSILVLNATSFIFLKISSQEVVEYLNEISS